MTRISTSPRTRKSVAEVPLGSLITLKHAEETYSGGANLFAPAGVNLRVNAIDVPYVWEKRQGEIRASTFVCVDFWVEGKLYRAGVDYYNIATVEVPDAADLASVSYTYSDGSVLIRKETPGWCTTLTAEQVTLQIL